MIARLYCPTCEESSLDTGGTRCAWCDGVLVGFTDRPRSRQRRSHGNLSDAQVDQIYDAYLKGSSVRDIAKVVWEKLGYANAHTCANSIYYNLDAAGYKLRSNATVLRRRNYRHGMGARDNKVAYKRWKRRQDPTKLRKCKGSKLTYPQKGRPCDRYALDGSDYCYQHDPEKRADVLAHVAKARAAA